MKKEEIYTKLFGFSAPTFYNWQRDGRPIIKLIEQYLEKEDLIEFLDTARIQKLEHLGLIAPVIKPRYFEIFALLFQSTDEDFSVGIFYDFLPYYIIFCGEEDYDKNNPKWYPLTTENEFKNAFLDFIENSKKKFSVKNIAQIGVFLSQIKSSDVLIINAFLESRSKIIYDAISPKEKYIISFGLWRDDLIAIDKKNHELSFQKICDEYNIATENKNLSSLIDAVIKLRLDKIQKSYQE